MKKKHCGQVVVEYILFLVIVVGLATAVVNLVKATGDINKTGEDGNGALVQAWMELTQKIITDDSSAK